MIVDGGWRMADGEWRMANGGWRMADGEWRMANGGRPPEKPKLLIGFDTGDVIESMTTTGVTR